jgi:hypothetical protein
MLRHAFLTPARAQCSKEAPQNTAPLRAATRHFIVALALSLCCFSASHAAPFLNLWLEGRKQGSNAQFSGHVSVTTGDTIEYRVLVDMAPIGTTNIQFGRERTIEELVPGSNGVVSLGVLTLLQSANDGIQTHFDAPATLANGWDAGIGARGGVSTPRAGSRWNDLVGVRAIQAPGVFTALDPEVAFTGTFRVANIGGPLSRLEFDWINGFGMRFNKWTSLFPTPANEDASDPLVRFSPLSLTGHYDIRAGDVTVSYADDSQSPASTLREQLVAGRGGPGIGNGAWTGPGITSSAAAEANTIVPESRAVGYADNAATSLGDLSAAGENDPSILIRYTRTGDANLDGVVNDDDLTIVSANYAPGVAKPHWALGDFDYNGFVDDDDVTLLGAFYDPSAAPIGAAVSDNSLNASPSSVAAIPEPATATLLVAMCVFAASIWPVRVVGQRSLRKSAIGKASPFDNMALSPHRFVSLRCAALAILRVSTIAIANLLSYNQRHARLRNDRRGIRAFHRNTQGLPCILLALDGAVHLAISEAIYRSRFGSPPSRTDLPPPNCSCALH